ncbi:MAG: hypothetical protein AB7I27_17055 [Bacteriovoracaceae bacterium]
MRIAKLIDRYVLGKRPVLRAVNPRVGTSVIPLDKGDGDLLFQYLTNKIHSLYFDGTEKQLTALINGLKENHGCIVQKMRFIKGRDSSRIMHLHLKLNDQEIRRMIKIG